MSRPTIQDALDDAVRSVARLDHGHARTLRPIALIPLPPIPLTLSVLAIVAAGLALAAVVAAVVALVLYAELGGDGFSDFVMDVRGYDWPLRTRLIAFGFAAAYAGVALATLAAAWLRGGKSWAALLAVGKARWRARDVTAIALATLAYAIVFTLIQVVGNDHRLLRTGPTDFMLLGALVGKVVILAPITEELLFRGWIYTALRARWPFAPSFLVTAAAFAAIHWEADHRHMLGVLPLALAVGLLRERSGSIRPTIALHAAYNLVIVAITLAAA